MRNQITFRQYSSYKTHRYGFLLNSFHDSRFPYTYKAVSYPAKSKAVDVLHYIKSAIDYTNYFLTEMEADQPIAGKTIVLS